MTFSWRIRLAHLFLTSFLVILIQATFYFKWIKQYHLDEGGYFAFLGWSIAQLFGSFAHDVAMWAAADTAESDLELSGSLPAESQKLLHSVASDSINFDHTTKVSRSIAKGRPRKWTACVSFACGGAFLSLLGYLVSGLGAVAPLTACYDGQRDFWGGFGSEVPCPTGGGGFSAHPPFVVPDESLVVTMWSMTQRAGSFTYHLFTSGTSLMLLAVFYLVSEIGWRRPSWWNDRIGALVFGLHCDSATDSTAIVESTHDSDSVATVRLRWHLLEVLGENSLAVYLMSDPVGDNITAMIPQDAPVWYFLLWGEVLYFAIIYVFTAYLRRHKLFLRL
jgi:hypothetical protein